LSGSQLLAKARVVTTARGNLIRWNGGAGGGWIWFVQLNVATSQEASGNNDGKLAGARIRQFQAESIHAYSGLSVVLRPGTELDAGIVGRRQVGVCRSANVADRRAWGRLEIAVDARTADMQASEKASRVVVNKIDVAEESTVFATADETEVGVISGIGEDKASAGGEITGRRKNVGFYRRSAESQEDRQQTSDQKSKCE